MKAFFSYFLVALVLLQTFSREVLVVNFTLNRATITARFCVNKARPQLHCDGRCYFAKKLKQEQERENKAPNTLKEKLDMLPLALRGLVPAAPVRYGRGPSGYAACPPAWSPTSPGRDVFQPPA